MLEGAVAAMSGCSLLRGLFFLCWAHPAIAQDLVNPLYRIEFRGVCSERQVGAPGSTLDDGGEGAPDFENQREGKTIEIWLVKSQSPEDDRRFGETHSWEFALSATGPLIITDITTNGTISCRVGEGPQCMRTYPDRTELTGLPYGMGPQTAENHGALSIVLLGTEGSFLAGDGEWLIAKIRVSGSFPNEEGRTDIGFILFDTRTGSRDTPTSTLVNYRFRPVTAEIGNPPLELDECEVRLTAGTASSFIRCNANDDLEVHISDAIGILQALFQGGPQAGCTEAADCNSDGNVDLSDAVFALSFLFRGGQAPASPFPDCGFVEHLDPERCPPGSSACRTFNP